MNYQPGFMPLLQPMAVPLVPMAAMPIHPAHTTAAQGPPHMAQHAMTTAGLIPGMHQALGALPHQALGGLPPHAQALSGLPHAQALSGLPHAQALSGLSHAQALSGLPHAQALSGLPHAQALGGLPQSLGGLPHTQALVDPAMQQQLFHQTAIGKMGTGLTAAHPGMPGMQLLDLASHAQLKAVETPPPIGEKDGLQKQHLQQIPQPQTLVRLPHGLPPGFPPPHALSPHALAGLPQAHLTAAHLVPGQGLLGQAPPHALMGAPLTDASGGIAMKRPLVEDPGMNIALGIPGANMTVLSQWQTQAEVKAPLMPAEPLIVLDDFNSDLNLEIDADGYGGHPILSPEGFCFCWSGARATHGVVRGKAFFEVHVTEHLPVEFPPDHQEQDPHIIRVGWSVNHSSMQLGEEAWSYGYGGTGKFSTSCKFQEYGKTFTAGDVIGCLLDLDSKPPTLSFTKNGTWLKVACTLEKFPVGQPDMGLFPHVLSKNCRFSVNFGQTEPWFSPPPEFTYISRLEKVQGMLSPSRKEDCEMIMIIGLPGSGKTTWAINMRDSNPEKRYNIIGTDSLIDKMKVMGLPRKSNFHGRWDVLIDKATKCLNKLFALGSLKNRNYILDQTNVYPSAQKRKMRSFQGFYRRAAVLVPNDAELVRRSNKRTQEDGKFVPEDAVLEMKANFKLPDVASGLFDEIAFVELQQADAQTLVDQYNREGVQKKVEKRPFQSLGPDQQVPPGQANQYQQSLIGAFPQQFDGHGAQYAGQSYHVGTAGGQQQQDRFSRDGASSNQDQRWPTQQFPPGAGAGQQYQPQDSGHSRGYEGGGVSGGRGAGGMGVGSGDSGRMQQFQTTEPSIKRSRMDQPPMGGDSSGSALDFIKQEYSGEEEMGGEGSARRQGIKAEETGYNYSQYGGQQPQFGGHVQPQFGNQASLQGQYSIPNQSQFGQVNQGQPQPRGQGFGQAQAIGSNLGQSQFGGQIASIKQETMHSQYGTPGHVPYAAPGQPLAQAGGPDQRQSSYPSQTQGQPPFSAQGADKKTVIGAGTPRYGGQGLDQMPYGQDHKPYSQDSKPCGQDSKPYGQDSKPHGQDSKPYGQDQKPYGQDEKPFSQGQKPFAQNQGEESKPFGQAAYGSGGQLQYRGQGQPPYGMDPGQGQSLLGSQGQSQFSGKSPFSNQSRSDSQGRDRQSDQFESLRGGRGAPEAQFGGRLSRDMSQPVSQPQLDEKQFEHPSLYGEQNRFGGPPPGRGAMPQPYGGDRVDTFGQGKVSEPGRQQLPLHRQDQYNQSRDPNQNRSDLKQDTSRGWPLQQQQGGWDRFGAAPPPPPPPPDQVHVGQRGPPPGIAPERGGFIDHENEFELDPSSDYSEEQLADFAHGKQRNNNNDPQSEVNSNSSYGVPGRGGMRDEQDRHEASLETRQNDQELNRTQSNEFRRAENRDDVRNRDRSTDAGQQPPEEFGRGQGADGGRGHSGDCGRDQSGRGRGESRGRPDDNRGRVDAGRSRINDSRGQMDDVRNRADDRRGRLDEGRGRLDDGRGRFGDTKGRPDDTRGRPDEGRGRSEDARSRPDDGRSRQDDRGRSDDARGRPDDNRGRFDDRNRSDDTRSRTGNERNQSDDRRGALDDRRGLSADRRGPNDDRHGPSSDRRGPADDRRGPTDGRRDMADDRRGLADNRRGPADDRRGPGDDRRGLADDRKRAADDWRGRPDRRDQSSDRRGSSVDFGRDQSSEFRRGDGGRDIRKGSSSNESSREGEGRAESAPHAWSASQDDVQDRSSRQRQRKSKWDVADESTPPPGGPPVPDMLVDMQEPPPNISEQPPHIGSSPQSLMSKVFSPGLLGAGPGSLMGPSPTQPPPCGSGPSPSQPPKFGSLGPVTTPPPRLAGPSPTPLPRLGSTGTTPAQPPRLGGPGPIQTQPPRLGGPGPTATQSRLGGPGPAQLQSAGFGGPGTTPTQSPRLGHPGPAQPQRLGGPGPTQTHPPRLGGPRPTQTQSPRLGGPGIRQTQPRLGGPGPSPTSRVDGPGPTPSPRLAGPDATSSTRLGGPGPTPTPRLGGPGPTPRLGGPTPTPTQPPRFGGPRPSATQPPRLGGPRPGAAQPARLGGPATNKIETPKFGGPGPTQTQSQKVGGSDPLIGKNSMPGQVSKTESGPEAAEVKASLSGQQPKGSSPNIVDKSSAPQASPVKQQPPVVGTKVLPEKKPAVDEQKGNRKPAEKSPAQPSKTPDTTPQKQDTTDAIDNKKATPVNDSKNSLSEANPLMSMAAGSPAPAGGNKGAGEAVRPRGPRPTTGPGGPRGQGLPPRFGAPGGPGGPGPRGPRQRAPGPAYGARGDGGSFGYRGSFGGHPMHRGGGFGGDRPRGGDFQRFGGPGGPRGMHPYGPRGGAPRWPRPY